MSLVVIMLSLRFAAPIEAAESLTAKSHQVLAQLHGEIVLPGLKEPVEVLRDRWGVPHIYAANPDDLFYAQGFVVAQDRLFQLDMWRRIAAGETAEVLGREGLEADRFARLLRYRGNMDAEWASYSPDARQIATAFTRGINGCIDHVADRLPVEFQILGTRPKKWKPEDVLGRMHGVIMVRNFRDEIVRAELVNAVGVEKARRLMPTDPLRDFAPAAGLDFAGIDQSVLAGYRAATRPLPYRAGGGSNNWVIDGALSASGKPILANDPHRDLNLPSLRYLVHLNAPGWNVIGSNEPGLPGVAIGHNDKIAWGLTIVGTDQADIYLEETHPEDSTRYKVGDGWQKMDILRESVAVRGEAEPTVVELRYTRHGPVLHHDPQRRRAFALRWVGAEPGGAGYLGCLALDRAENVSQFLKAAEAWKLPSENLAYGDVDGNIGWIAAALTPVRPAGGGLLPTPGAVGDYDWQGFLSVKELPQSFNPPSHYLATANHNILPPGFGREIAYEWSPRYRYTRICQRLESKSKFDVEDFKKIQHDNVSLPGQALSRLIRGVEMTDESLKPYQRMLAEWDGELSIDAEAGPLYTVWLRELIREIYRPHVPESLLEAVAQRGGAPVVLAALESPDPSWFGENPRAGRDEFVRRTFSSAVTKLHNLQTEKSRTRKGFSWGQLHTAAFRHPLAGLDPAIDQAFSLAPVPRSGDGHCPNATGSDDRDRQVRGASYRQVFDLADWDRGMATSVPGQSGQPGSPHYADLLPLWAEGTYFPLVFSRAKVEEVTAHKLSLRPNREKGRR
jgi:penicillin amidase